MIINSNSWHVKLHDRFYDRHSRPHSLCAYFWKMVWACFACAVVAGSTLFGLTVAGAGVLEHFFVLSTPVLLSLGFVLGLIAIALIIALSIGLALGAMNLHAWYDARREEKEWQRIQAEREGRETKENIVVQYIKARKSKMCPVIHFENKE
ncbi:hypothetical protein EpJS10_0090 [Escherichia phage JS10]|uniref:Uncharacterized protein n=2 Tax=Dhakavirus TaxID=1914165 RepID=C4MZI5_9CAUD|nr:membrane protein [Escherichia phage JS98]YP_002922439.1 membrane protein [Escherichia phage JS10]ABX11076.1 hypothetical protein EpJS98_0092 [Escherichia phage JS98]ACL78316.1 hypothetical protein EpJS10_0090 [Escherichia phage JS10]CAI9865945.1 membrane protein [Escherichia phage UP19]